MGKGGRCRAPEDRHHPQQGKVKGAMRETLQEGLKYLSDFDLDAIADYLFAQPPIVHEVRPKR